MTHSLVLELELLSPTVLTADASTLGGHQTLQHIPGGLLKGALAARCYAQVLKEQGEEGTFAWFHSNALRIGDALPVHPRTGRVGFPMPLALVTEKNAAPWTDGVLSGAVGARTQLDFSMTGQLRQVRSGFLTDGLHRVQPRTREHMRTAMRADGRARDGHLFSESFLEPGQRFRAVVQTDSAERLSGLAGALDGSEIRVGRGRSTGQGRARVRVVEKSTGDRPTTASGTAGRLVVWCLSDLALCDARTGAATLVPHAQHHFGLPEDWIWIPEDSHVRSRSWSPFNAHRRRYDLERHVLTMGSVLVFRGSSAVELAELDSRCSRGIGAHTGEGLGRVSLNATLLVEGPSGRAQPLPPAPTVATCPIPNDRLGQWVRRRMVARADEQSDRKTATAWVDTLPPIAVRKIGASQWSALANVARRPDVHTALELFLSSGRRLDSESWCYRRQGDRPVDRVRNLAKEHSPRCVQFAAELARKEAIRLAEKEQ